MRVRHIRQALRPVPEGDYIVSITARNAPQQARATLKNISPLVFLQFLFSLFVIRHMGPDQVPENR